MIKYYCPTCNEPIEILEACGSTSYFCTRCKKLISSKDVIIKQDQ